jgi:hypothetical protein
MGPKYRISPNLNNPFYHPNEMKISHQKYLTGDVWKCNLSPSGAHFWEVNNQNMECKYCHASKLTWPIEVKEKIFESNYFKKNPKRRIK